MAVSSKEFKRICLCEIAKYAWKILEVTQEGNKAMNSKLWMLTSKFEEEIKMNDDETFGEFLLS
jgi:hypothetical protein